MWHSVLSDEFVKRFLADFVLFFFAQIRVFPPIYILSYFVGLSQSAWSSDLLFHSLNLLMKVASKLVTVLQQSTLCLKYMSVYE